VLHGLSFVRQFRNRTPEQVKALYAELASLMASGELVARIAGVYPLDRIVDACEHAGKTGDDRDGKIIISLNN